MTILSKWQWHDGAGGWVASWSNYAYLIRSSPKNPPPFPVKEWAASSIVQKMLVDQWEDGTYMYKDGAGTHHIPIQ